MSAVLTELEYSDHVQRLREQDSSLASEVANFHGIEAVLQWMQQRGLGQTAVDIVGQDEFSYDFLVDLKSGGQWLGFAVT